MEGSQTLYSESLFPTRIAIYDNMLAAPRIIDIQPTELSQYIENISTKTYELSLQQGGSIPYTVIKEVCENFIHADFKNPCISILDAGDTIKFTDQGPGIPDKERAVLPGFTSANTEMRKYIRGVGSGLPTVKDYLKFSNGHLIIEDNIKEGTVVTITIDKNKNSQSPIIYSETSFSHEKNIPELSEREYNILLLVQKLGLVGPTEIKQNLGISLATGHRELEYLEERGFIKKTQGGKKRILTDSGLTALRR